MEAVKEQGLAKNIGISNVAGPLLIDIMRSVAVLVPLSRCISS